MTSATVVRILVAAALLVASSAPAFAQGPYVGAAIGADVSRVSGADGEPRYGDGEAVFWSLRVGTPVASRFGVDLEFVRPQEISRTDIPDVRILNALNNGALSYVFTSLTPAIFPPISISTTVAQRNTTVATTAWIRQEVTARFAMRYLGGIAFNRISREFSYRINGGGPNVLASALLPRSSTTIEYGVGPVVGTEAEIGMTSHLQLAPGIRLQTGNGGWMIRPAVGLMWQF